LALGDQLLITYKYDDEDQRNFPLDFTQEEIKINMNFQGVEYFIGIRYADKKRPRHGPTGSLGRNTI
jgi:hypothetical protein